MRTKTKNGLGGLVPVIVATSFGFVVVQLDVTIVNVALPRIGSDLHASVAGLQWVVDAYILAFAVLLLSAGVIGDRHGRPFSSTCGFPPGLSPSPRPPPRPSLGPGERRPSLETPARLTMGTGVLYLSGLSTPQELPPARVSPRFFRPANRPPPGLPREDPVCFSLDLSARSLRRRTAWVLRAQ